uniref:Helix-turn-helix DNA binding domain protein n=1 Tax=Micrococcus phage Kurnik TaxID=3092208 RepID=A0AAU6R659_9CAUD
MAGRNSGSITAEMEARALELYREGFTSSWIADDLGVKMKNLRNLAERRGWTEPVRNAAEWAQVWSSIFRTPELYKIHCEIRPKAMAR